MHKEQTKKLLPLYILRILQRYSDADHPLSQKMIQDKLSKIYDMDVSTKAIKNNLEWLEEYGETYPNDFGDELVYHTIARKAYNSNESENIIKTDYYLSHQFTDGELQLLIDSVVFSGKLSKQEANELVDKLCTLSSEYFKTKSIIASMPDSATTANHDVIYNLEILSEAIRKECQVSFHYLEYHTDKKQHMRLGDDGKAKKFIINPYQLVTKGGRNYLICNNDNHNALSNYRVDRISGMKLLENKQRKPFTALKDSKGQSLKSLDLKKYMDEHSHMFAGESVRTELRIKSFLVSEVIDRFGLSVRFKDEAEDSVTAVVTANENAMMQFAKELIPYVEVLSPRSLREKIREDLAGMLEKYSESV